MITRSRFAFIPSPQRGAALGRLGAGRVAVLRLAWLLLLSGWLASPAGLRAQVREAFGNNPVASGRFTEQTSGTESRFQWNSLSQDLTATFDVDRSPADYLSVPFSPLTDQNDMSFSVRFRVESFDDQFTPAAFLGLMTTNHVQAFGDGLTMVLSITGGRPVANAGIDSGAFPTVAGKQVELNVGTDYLAVGRYKAVRREFSLEILTGAGYTNLVGFSKVFLPSDHPLRLDRIGLQNAGAEDFDRDVGSITVTVDDLSTPGSSAHVISISDAPAVREGDTGTQSMAFEVNLMPASSQEISVQWTTGDGSATAGSDYLPTDGTLTFSPGQATALLNVTVLNDTVYESDETLRVLLSGSDDAPLGRAEATGVIQNNDLPPVVSIADATVAEPDAGFDSEMVFELTLTGATELPATVNYRTADGTARAGFDYQATEGTLQFAPGVSRLTIPVRILGDSVSEQNETFAVNLSSASGARLGDAQALGTILDFGPRWLSISSNNIVEGNAGLKTLFFPVRLSRTHTVEVTVQYSVASGTATVGLDLPAASGTLRFSPGTLTNAIAVQVMGDVIPEEDETFYVNLSNPVNASIGQGQGLGIILNDDPYPRLAVQNAAGREGDSGLTDLTFTVRLSGTTNVPVTVHYAATDSPTDEDYLATAGTLFFPPGTTVQTISVPVVGDKLDEEDETFRVRLSSPTPSFTILDVSEAVGTILDDDDPPSIRLGNIAVAEGHSGTTAFSFPFSLTAPSGKDVTLSCATSAGTAMPPDDYTSIPLRSLSFPKGTTHQSVTVLVNGDATYEPDEVFYLNFSNPINATLEVTQAMGTILNDDPPPTLSIGDAPAVTEQPGGVHATFPVTLSRPSFEVVTVTYATQDGSALASSDYLGQQGILTFPAGSITPAAPLTVFVLDDTLHETDETFSVVFTGAGPHVTMPANRATGLIHDNDPVRISIDDVRITEPDSGSSNAVFTVSLSSSSAEAVSVQFRTQDGTARAGSDYTATTGTVTFPPFTTTQPIPVAVHTDGEAEADETFTVILSNPAPPSVTVERSTGLGTILDRSPELSIDDIVVAEGTSGTTTEAMFTVTLSAPSRTPVTVSYQTADGSAKAGSDYRSTSGTLTFSPGITSLRVPVLVYGDDLVEPDETFYLDLSNAAGAKIRRTPGTATIADGSPCVTIDDVTVLEPKAGFSTNAVFTIQLSRASATNVTVSYSTVDGTATSATGDYLARSGQITFPPGVTRTNLGITVQGDALPEPDETFLVVLRELTNARACNLEGLGIIHDETLSLEVEDLLLLTEDCGSGDGAIDPMEKVKMALSLVNRGTLSTTNLTVTLLATNGITVFSAPQTYGAMAPGGSAVARPFTFKADGACGETKTLVFHLQDGSTDLGTITHPILLGRIINGEPVCCYATDLAISARADVAETVVGAPLTYTITVTNRGPSLAPDVTLTNRLGSGLEFVSSAGSPSAPVVSGDLASYSLGDLPPAATITLTLTATPRSAGTIISLFLVFTSGNDPDPNNNLATVVTGVAPSAGLRIGNASVTEGDTGASLATFLVALWPPATQLVSVDYRTTDQTATAGTDYEARAGTLSFAPRQTNSIVTVPVLGDLACEPDETFLVLLSHPVGAPLAATYTPGVGTIVNNDPPCVSVNNPSAHAGETAALTFTLRLSCPRTSPVVVPYQTVDRTAIAGLHYQRTGGTITFLPGSTEQSLTVAIIEDPNTEGNREFLLNLGEPPNARLCTPQGVGTIIYAPPLPALSVEDVKVYEGDTGTTVAQFVATLSRASTNAVTAEASTADGTAHAGSDYAALVGYPLTFLPGVTRTNIDILVVGDTEGELNETFHLNLVNPRGATLGRGQAVGTILNDDPLARVVAAGLAVVDESCQPPNQAPDPSERVTVQLALRNEGLGPTTNLVATLQAGGGVIPFSTAQAYGILNPNAAPVSRPFVLQVNRACGEPFTLSLQLQDGPRNLGLVHFDGTMGVKPDGTLACCLNADLGVSIQASPSSVVVSNNLFYTIVVTNSGPAQANQVQLTNKLSAGQLFLPALSGPGTFRQTGDLLVWDLGAMAPLGAVTLTLAVQAAPPAVPASVTGIAIVGALESDPVSGNNTAVAAANVTPQTGIAISDASVTEGGSALLTVQLYPQSGRSVSVNYSTRDGSAQGGLDYPAQSGTLTFAPGVTRLSLTVPTLDDPEDEPAETFHVDLYDPVNASLAKSRGTVTILDNDPPSVSINDPPPVNVGLSGDSLAVFTVSLSSPDPTNVVTVGYSTVDGTAVGGLDYIPIAGTLRFPPGVTSSNLTVIISGNTIDEGEEAFCIRLFDPTHARLGKQPGCVTITDEGKALLSIAPAPPVAEGDQGFTKAVFTLTLDAPLTKAPVRVNYYTTNVTAMAGRDYVATNGMVEIPARSTQATITVPVIGDTINEADESFLVRLTEASSAVLKTDQAPATILDDDPISVTLADASVLEGDTGATNAAFDLSLSGPSEQTVTVTLATADETATAPGDYSVAIAPVIFAPGETNKPVLVRVVGDRINEANETFVLRITDAAPAAVGRGRAIGTILDDDPASLSISHAPFVTEGDSGTTSALFLVQLSPRSEQLITVAYETADDSARAGQDYIRTNGVLSFQPGDTEKTIAVPVMGDSTPEPAETFRVNLSQPVHAALGRGQGAGTILDDDSLISVSDVVVSEAGPGATTNAVFTVSLSAPNNRPVSVAYRTSDGTATSPADYQAISPSRLLFEPGNTATNVSVIVRSDDLVEGTEAFYLELSEPVGGALARPRATGTILDNVPQIPPVISVSHATVREGDAGVRTQAVFTLTLSKPGAQAVTVDYATSDGTALAGQDYAPISPFQTLRFEPGATQSSVSVEVLGDDIPEATEVFYLDLSRPTGATLATNRAVGTILDEERLCPPSVTVLTPADRECFTRFQTILISTVPTAAGREVSRMELYAGGTLLGTVFRPEPDGTFNFSWENVDVGEYVLSARAYCFNGQVTFSDPVRVRVAENATHVAIIRNVADDPEISTLQEYLWEMGLCSQVFDEADVTYELVRDFSLIIWDDLGDAGHPVTPKEVELFQRVWTDETSPRGLGMPLYLIGDHLVSGAANLDEPHRSQWLGLLHLRPTVAASGSCGAVAVFETLELVPIMKWWYGTVRPFSYANDVDLGLMVDAGTEEMAWCGATPVFAATPGPHAADLGEVRTVTQAFRVTTGGDAASLESRKSLFQNTVCWLLRSCNICPSLDLALRPEMQVFPETVRLGEPIHYRQNLQLGGECRALAVAWTNWFPASVEIVDANSTQGQPVWDNGRHMVRLWVGTMRSAQEVELTVTVIPTQPGAVTNLVGVGLNWPDVHSENNFIELVTEVQGKALRIRSLGPGLYELHLEGISDRPYQIEASTDLKSWQVVVPNVTAETWSMPLPESPRCRFYRAVER